MTDSAPYGNDYTLHAMMRDLTDAVFEDDMRSNVNGFRQNLQVEYVTSLLAKIDSKSVDYVSRSASLSMIRLIKRWMESWSKRGDAATRAHRDHLLFLIDRKLEAN